ncbi:cation acetate symporter [Kitasatospora paranensis]
MVFLGMCGFLWLFTASGHDDTAMFPTRGTPGKAWHSGLAISGDSLSAVTLMALVGLIAFTGYDGIMLSVGCVMSLVLLALLIAEPLRKAGGHTVGDALARRFPGRSVRTAVAVVTLAVCLPYLVLQLTAISALTCAVLGLTGGTAKTACVIVLGSGMISLALTGGMRGTARIQIVKVIALLLALAVVAVLVLHRFHWNPDRLLGAAASHSLLGDGFLGPGALYGHGWSGMANRIGQLISLALGIGFLPQVTMRVLAAPPGRATRTAMHWAVAQFLAVSAFLVVIGLGTAAILGSPALHQADPSGSSALLLITNTLKPNGVLVSVVICVVFLTALTTVTDVTLAAATSMARDLTPGEADRHDTPTRRQEHRARWAAALAGVVTIAVAVKAVDWNLLVLTTLALTLSSSGLAPVLFYGLLWPRFTARGALWCLYGSSVLGLLLIAVSPLISGSPAAAFPGWDFHRTTLANPALVTVPVGFALGWLGSITDRRDSAAEHYGKLATASLVGRSTG